MIRLIDNRTKEQISTDRLNHGSQVAIKHATGYFTRERGSVPYDNAFCAANYARITAHEAFNLHPDLRAL